MYKAILFATDGDYVTDFERKTKEEVEKEIENMGSRWIFYPITGIIKMSNTKLLNNRVNFDYPEMKSLNKCSVKTVIQFLKETDVSQIL